jgi:membrane-bound lytic murein transglycosylase B
MAAFVMFAGSCETSAPAPPLSGPREPAPKTETGAISFKSSGNDAFDSWRSQFSSRALSSGHPRAVVVQVLSGLTPMEQQVKTAAFEQAEFVKPIWDYANSAVTPSRITNGQAKLSELSATLAQIENQYAPPREILGAIWGMESAYGAFMGNIDAPAALATQAAIGRRKDFNETELLSIMQLVEDGAATRDQFATASWAGAVGQTQFMPSTFLRHARDFDGDGRKDLWKNAGDALASAANYLSYAGWRKGEPWAVEVTVPQGFDYGFGDGRKLSVADWGSMGITPALGKTPSPGLQAELFLPAGSYGPAFLLFDNFKVIKTYNNADSYALAVGLLADRLAGGPGLVRPWPTTIKMLTTNEAKDLQDGLNRLGFDAGSVDGVIGRGTRGALQRFQKAKGLTADGFPTVDMLAAVKGALGG